MPPLRALCAGCFDNNYPGHRPVPVVAYLRDAENCAICGRVTRAGIYARLEYNKVALDGVDLTLGKQRE